VKAPESGYNVCPNCLNISDTVVTTENELDSFLCMRCGLRWYWYVKGQPVLVRLDNARENPSGSV